jgi:2'-5' RNA ligase
LLLWYNLPQLQYLEINVSQFIFTNRLFDWVDMMKSKFLCVMAQYDNKTELKLKEIQKVLSDNGFVGKQTPDLSNHITLGSFDISQEELIKEQVRMVSKQFHSFEIKLNHIGLFGLDVLFIAPSVNHELLNLQQYFNNNYADGLGWAAHTTMLIDDHKTILKALPYVAENFKSFTGKIESISLYEFWPTRFILEEKLL